MAGFETGCDDDIDEITDKVLSVSPTFWQLSLEMKVFHNCGM